MQWYKYFNDTYDRCSCSGVSDPRQYTSRLSSVAGVLFGENLVGEVPVTHNDGITVNKLLVRCFNPSSWTELSTDLLAGYSGKNERNAVVLVFGVLMREKALFEILKKTFSYLFNIYF